LRWPNWQVDTHNPEAHIRVATFTEEHARPMAPQLSTFVFVSMASQPSSGPVAGLVRLSQPVWQIESQTPPVQVTVATFSVEHARPSAPQFAVFAVGSIVSQPSSLPDAGWFRLSQPVWQVELQTPSVQDRVATCSVEQTRPGAPQ
jgi:hypothetical protein